jgi:hypothetical protein
MTNISKHRETLTSDPCGHCGGLMRLVGTEPHPVHDGTDLFTYACTACDALQVITVPLPPTARSTFQPALH